MDALYEAIQTFFNKHGTTALPQGLTINDVVNIAAKHFSIETHVGTAFFICKLTPTDDGLQVSVEYTPKVVSDDVMSQATKQLVQKFNEYTSILIRIMQNMTILEGMSVEFNEYLHQQLTATFGTHPFLSELFLIDHPVFIEGVFSYNNRFIIEEPDYLNLQPESLLASGKKVIDGLIASYRHDLLKGNGIRVPELCGTVMDVIETNDDSLVLLDTGKTALIKGQTFLGLIGKTITEAVWCKARRAYDDYAALYITIDDKTYVERYKGRQITFRPNYEINPYDLAVENHKFVTVDGEETATQEINAYIKPLIENLFNDEQYTESEREEFHTYMKACSERFGSCFNYDNGEFTFTYPYPDIDNVDRVKHDLKDLLDSFSPLGRLDVKVYNDLLGKTITRVVETAKEFYLLFDDGTYFRLYHEQCCCETVELVDVDGDIDDLVGGTLREAEVVTHEWETSESERWTYYKFGTQKGSVSLRWYGSHNGYYSNTVDEESGPITDDVLNDIDYLP